MGPAGGIRTHYFVGSAIFLPEEALTCIPGGRVSQSNKDYAKHREKRFNVKEAEDLLINAQYAIVELLKFNPYAPREGLERVV